MKSLLGLNLQQILEAAVKESVQETIGDEKLLQKKTADQLRSFKATKKKSKMDQTSPEKDVDEAEESASADGLKEPVKPKKSELPEITITRVVDKLNSLRAGKSLKDKELKKELNDYFTKLNGNERVALYAFLTGLDKIMGAEPEESVGAKTPSPRQEPFSIDMKKDSPKVSSKKEPKGEESPIIVGEVASKRKEMLTVRKNRATLDDLK